MSTPEFVTVLKKDKEFQSYLDGTFSSHKRAIPQKVFYANTENEKVTFLIFEKDQIKLPNIILLLGKLFRVEWLSLSFGPAIACIGYAFSKGQSVDILYMGLSLLSLFCFHSAVFALNDYKDHMGGSDRVNQLGGSQVIQKGWLPANFVKSLGVIMFGMGAAVGFFVLINQPLIFIASVLFISLLVLIYSFNGPNLKAIGFGEILAFICFGPLIVFGFTSVLGSPMGAKEWALSLLFGQLAFLIMQARQLENIVADSRSGERNLVTYLGFDKAKKFIGYQLFLNWTLFAGFMYSFSTASIALFLLFPYGFYCWGILRTILGSRSPLSSDLESLRYRVVDLHVLLSTFVLISFWI